MTPKLYQYIIQNTPGIVHGFRLEEPQSKKEIERVLNHRFTVKRKRFPFQDKIMDEEVLIYDRMIWSTRFIMSIRKFEVQPFKFLAVWDSPVLNLTNDIVDYGWQKGACDQILIKLINEFKDNGDSKDVTAFLKVLKLAVARDSDLVDEIIFAMTVAVTDTRAYHYGTVIFSSYSKAIGLPDTSYEFDDPYSKIKRLCRDMILHNWNSTETLDFIQQVIAYFDRWKIKLSRLTQIGEILFPENPYKYQWLDKNNAKRVLRFMNSDINPDKIAERMKYKEKYNQCFISFSFADIEFAEKLYKDLTKNGVQCWYAPKDAKGGEKLYRQISEAINSKDKMILLLSDASMSSEWVKTEIAKVRKREVEEGTNLLFPLSLVEYDKIREWENFDADTGKDSAREIREYYILDFTNWRDTKNYRKQLNKLLMDLQKLDNQNS